MNTAHAFLYHWRATYATASGGRSSQGSKRVGVHQKPVDLLRTLTSPHVGYRLT
jgi:hypothetical protein